MGSPAESGFVGMSAVELADGIRAGIWPEGLPNAAQLIAAPGDEDRLPSLASMIEQQQPWPRHAPL
jgi:Asp-tRNA(Asn)/Glu-tRNA(Gln) amidotransferase A subunit family amidase